MNFSCNQKPAGTQWGQKFRGRGGRKTVCVFQQTRPKRDGSGAQTGEVAAPCEQSCPGSFSTELSHIQHLLLAHTPYQSEEERTLRRWRRIHCSDVIIASQVHIFKLAAAGRSSFPFRVSFRHTKSWKT